jgi:hypothetical protein
VTIILSLALTAMTAVGQNYSHVVITCDSLVPRFSPLCSFVAGNLGLSDTVVTTENIYAQFSGRDNPERIRNFIKYAYADWGTTHVLLGGDVEIVPCRRAFVDARRYIPQLLDTIPADLYFADLDGDWDRDGDSLFGEPEDSCDMYPDIFVGRLPATTVGEADLLVAKFVAYTGDPDAAYLRNVLLSGFDILKDLIFCETTMEFYDSAYVPAGMKPCCKVYDSYEGNHEEAVTNEVNEGQHIWIHADHCSYWGMGMGYVNHDYVMYRDELARFSNAGKYTIMTSLGCMTGMFDTSDCAAEVFMLDPGGGGLAVASNSRYSLSGSGTNPQRECSFMLLEGFVRGLFADPHQASLEAVASSWSGVVPLADTCPAYRWCLFDWNLLGEAAMPVWMPMATGLQAEKPPLSADLAPGATIVRSVLSLQGGSGPLTGCRTRLLDVSGRKVLDLTPGANDVSGLAPGVYYVVPGPNSGDARKIIKAGKD